MLGFIDSVIDLVAINICTVHVLVSDLLCQEVGFIFFIPLNKKESENA